MTDRLEKRLKDISRAVDAATERARRAVAERLGGDPSAAPDGDRQQGLQGLSIPALHKLEQVNAELRHSLVEDSLYNLRVLAQTLPEKHTAADYRGKLGRSLSTLDLVFEHLESYFAFELAPGVTVRSILPEASSDAERAAADLKLLAATDPEDVSDADQARRFTEKALAGIDLLLRAVDLAGRSVGEVMHSPIELLERIVETHQGAARGNGVEVVVVNETGNRPRIIGREARLANAYSEVIRNALAHGFPDGNETSAARQLKVVASWSDRKRQFLVLSFEDSGGGFAGEVAESLGERGVTTGGSGEGLAMVRRIVEGEHLGRVEFGRSSLGGAAVRLMLPYKFTETN